MPRRAAAPTGTRCRWCESEIVKQFLFKIWVHKDGGNVHCSTSLPGLTAKYAEPK